MSNIFIDYLEQPISMGDIVTYTTSVRSSNLHTGVVAGRNEDNNTVLIKRNGNSNIKGGNTWNSGNLKFVRVQVITNLYLGLQKQDQEVLDLRQEFVNQPWPVKKKPAMSSQSPKVKWLRSWEKRCLEVTQDYRNNASWQRGMTGIVTQFTTTHNGVKFTTVVNITKNHERVQIYEGNNTYRGLLDCAGKDGWEYRSPDPKPVAGVSDWFLDPDIEQAVDTAIKKVRAA